MQIIPYKGWLSLLRAKYRSGGGGKDEHVCELTYGGVEYCSERVLR